MSDDEYQRLLDQLPQQIMGALNWSKYIPRLFQAGRRTGLSDMQIRDDAWNKLQGQISERQFRAVLPPTAKHNEMSRVKFAAISPQIDKIIELPAPKQEIKEIEPEPKAKSTDTEIILDCNKFRIELRTGLLNNAKVKLQVKHNQVINIE